MVARTRRVPLGKVAGPVFAAILFALAIRLLIGEIQNTTWAEFKSGLGSIQPLYLGFAALLIAMNYALLIAYDLLALRYICRSLPLRRVALVSFLGYSLGNNLGSLLAATPLRFRFYGRWGLTKTNIVAVLGMLALTFWSGLWFLGGLVLVIAPIQLPPEYALPFSTRVLGVLLLSMAATYLLTCWLWRRPWPVGGIKLVPPEPGLMATQASVAAVDLLISATALYLVLPVGPQIYFSLVLAAYLTAIAVAIISQVPGGLGVLEIILWFLLKDAIGDRGQLAASLLIFRALYYVLPLLFGMVTLVAHEIYAGTIESRTHPNAPANGGVV